MGTSSAFGGPNNSTPLVPTWLEPDTPMLPTAPSSAPPDMNGQGDRKPSVPTEISSNPAVIQPPIAPNRFQTARTNLTQFAGSGGSSSSGLGRAISHYVSKSSGGARQAARRMGSSRKSGSRLLGFLADTIDRGASEALRALSFESLAEHPIGDIFLGMIDYICPDGGSVDEGIARDAFIETIVDLAEFGIVDLNSLNSEQMQTVFELYATHTIENRIYNDIGTKAIQIPSDARLALRVQAQLRDFIRRGVADAITTARNTMRALTKDSVRHFVDRVYVDAFTILQKIGEMEATAI